MELHLDCIPCAQQQALRAARAAGVSPQRQEMILRSVLGHLAKADWDRTPMSLGMSVHQMVRRLSGVDDPFSQAKARSNELALQFYPELRQQVREAHDPLHMAVRFAIAGNIMDLGALGDFDLEATLERVADLDFAVDDSADFVQHLDEARSLILFADNAGEIVFDRLLIETMLARRPLEVSVVVKSGPFINDATVRDAEEAGLTDLAGVRVRQVSNGDDDGSPAYDSGEVSSWIQDHDVVIAKGQGNYEALSEYSGVFFMLMAKCPAVASHIGVEVGDIIVQLR